MDGYTSPERLADQYSDAHKLTTRQETHRLYGERRPGFLAWATDLMDIQPGMTVVDVGCGRGIYHLHFNQRGANQGLAMQELRRIVRPGGRVVIATNGAHNNERMHEVARLAASDLRRPGALPRTSPFRLEDLDRVREIFPNARVEIFHNAFRFPDAEPALAYWRSMRDDPELEAAMRPRIAEIIRTEGMFRVPLVAGCFVADV